MTTFGGADAPEPPFVAQFGDLLFHRPLSDPSAPATSLAESAGVVFRSARIFSELFSERFSELAGSSEPSISFR